MALLAEAVLGQDLAGGVVPTRPECQTHLSHSVLEVDKLSMGVAVNMHLSLLTKFQGLSINL